MERVIQMTAGQNVQVDVKRLVLAIVMVDVPTIATGFVEVTAGLIASRSIRANLQWCNRRGLLHH